MMLHSLSTPEEQHVCCSSGRVHAQAAQQAPLWGLDAAALLKYIEFSHIVPLQFLGHTML